MTIALRNRNWFRVFVQNILLRLDLKAVRLLTVLVCCTTLLAGCGTESSGSGWPTNPIESATIVDSQNIWITTDRAELVYIKDGTRAVPQFENDVAAVDFINREAGWLLLKTGDVLRTRNGGTTWQNIGKVQRKIRGKWPFWTPNRMMKFADENAGWIVAGDSVFRTDDGGMTWKVIDFTANGQPNQIVVVNSKEFWSVTWQGIVVHTLDGGATWHTSDLPNRKEGESYPRSIARDSTGSIWVGDRSPEPVLYSSNDQGKTWDKRIFPAEPEQISVESIQFAQDGVGRIVFRRLIETDRPMRTSLAVTTDFGLTWKLLPIDDLSFEPQSIKFVSGTVGFLIGKSSIAMTDDAGKIWKLIYTSRAL